MEKQQLTHRIIAATFFGPCPEGMQVNHINGDRLDNRLQNLEYVTPSENQQHAYTVLGRTAPKGSEHHNAKANETMVRSMREMYKIGWTKPQLAEHFKMSRQTVHGIVTGKWWKHVK